MNYKAMITTKSGLHITAFFEYSTTDVLEATSFVWRSLSHGTFARIGTTIVQASEVEIVDVYAVD